MSIKADRWIKEMALSHGMITPFEEKQRRDHVISFGVSSYGYLFAEWSWRHRWEGTSPVVRLKPDDFPTFESLRARWTDEEKLLMSFVENVTDARLNSHFFYTTTKGEPHERILWHVMAHLVNHGTQHRSEAAALLTDFGHSPGDIDLVYFLSEM